MACCNHCRDAEGFFGHRTGRRELRRYRRRGPPRSTRLLLDALRGTHVPNATLLDIGGGIGAIQHELLQDGFQAATHVDASAAYLALAQEEADRLGHGDRVTYLHGDFVELAPEIPMADVVTLDRVICCYPDVEALVEASAFRARRVYGLVYPRERWGTRIALALANLYLRIRRSAFRVYMHPTARVNALVRGLGFRRGRTARTFLWQVVTYHRDS
jgi:hypothetical protein